MFVKSRTSILLAGLLLLSQCAPAYGYSYDSVCPTGPKGETGGQIYEGDGWTNSDGGYWYDTRHFAQCNCTSYAAEMAGIASNNGLSHARNWDNRARELDYPVSPSVPTWGAVIQWNENTGPAEEYGHVGYVEWVNFDKNSGTITGLQYSDWNGEGDHDGPGGGYISASSTNFTSANFIYAARPELNRYESGDKRSICLDAFPTYGYALCWEYSGSSETCENASRNYVVWDHERCPDGCSMKSVDKSLCPPLETYTGIKSQGRTNLLSYYSPSGSMMKWTASFGGGTPPTPPIGPNPLPIPGSRADLRPDFDIYNTDGHEISSNCDDCSGESVDVNQHVRPKLWTQVNNNADAGKWKRKSNSDTIEGPVWWKIEGKTDWTLLGSGEYTIGKLDKGDQISETHDFFIPSYPGDIIAWKACVDGDDEIYEESEDSSQHKITNPDQSGTTNNCSRTERNYIRIPNYPPTGSVDGGDCNGFSGWARDDNTSDPIRINIYANGEYAGQPLANQYRSDVGNHAFAWVTPESFKDGVTRTLSLYAVDFPDGIETPIGSRVLTCAPPVLSYDLATIATWIEGEYTLSVGSHFTIRGVIQNLGDNPPHDAIVTSTLIHEGGTEYPMGSATILAGKLLSGWNADASISAIAPAKEGRYRLKTCVAADLQETNAGNNCLEENGPFIPPVQNGLSDDEDAAIWIINHNSRRRVR